ncbi:MAG: hypothetical protein JJE51_05120 [Thermoanaerobaculia bacterium]|nr:hypothetical protein [Thermoanaerobaculia bacterium]
MPTGNFDDPATANAAPTETKHSLRLPADYYTAPLSEVRPVFPKWVPWGCGTAAAIFLGILFAGGALLNGPRLGQVIDFVMGTTLGELRPMIAADVTPQLKQQFEDEVKRMREGLRNGQVVVQNVQPFLKAMQKAVSDEKVTAAELGELTVAARKSRSPVKGNRLTGKRPTV